MLKFPMELIVAVDCWKSSDQSRTQKKRKMDGRGVLGGVLGICVFLEKWMLKRKRFFGRALV